MNEFNSDDHCICHCGQASLRRNIVAIMVNRSVCEVQYLGGLKSDRMIVFCFQGTPFSITVIQVCARTKNAEVAEVGWFYVDLQDLL